MPSLRFDTAQHFTCRQCSRCCRRPWEIALTAAEVAAYRKAGAERWFRDAQTGPEGTDRDPFSPLAGPLPFRIRKRADGACGFLSAEGRCRIHEEMGMDRKPLTCRLFPYQFQAAGEEVVMTTSFSCPTVARNDGAALTTQLNVIASLRKAWVRDQGPVGPAATPIEIVSGRPLTPNALATLRSVLRQMLERPGALGPPDLRGNVDRMARTLEDLARYRVLRLPPDAFAEYVELTGRHAAGSHNPLPPRPPGALGRLLFRGLLFVVLAGRLQAEDGRRSGLRLGLRVRLLRLLLHVHGLGSAVAGIDLRRAKRVELDLQSPALHPLALHFLRSRFETLGTGRQAVLGEISLAVALLNAALVLATLAAAAEGKEAVDEPALIAGLTQAADLEHVESRSALGGVVRLLAGGVEALYQLATAHRP